MDFKYIHKSFIHIQDNIFKGFIQIYIIFATFQAI